MYFAFIWSIGRSYWVRDGYSAIIFVKHVKTVFVKVLPSADAWIVSLFWKLPQMPSCSANNADMDKNNFEMFYKIDCCAAIHGRIWINNVPNESRIIMKSVLLYLFSILRNLESNPGFLFLTYTVYHTCHVFISHIKHLKLLM